MRDLFRAEWTKIVGNRWAVGCMIWVFPVGAVAIFGILALILLLSSEGRADYARENHLWTDQMLGVWMIPNNPLGRLLLLGFTGVVFGGEYQWNTWKNLVPRERRTRLMLIKFFTLGVLVLFAFVLMSFIMLITTGILVEIAGGTYGPTVTGDVLADFVGDYLSQAALAFTSTVIAAGYAALAAMITRSILGGVLVGFAATFIENLSAAGLVLIAFLLTFPDILQLYRLTPGYNLLNVSSWLFDHRALDVELPYKTNHSIVLSDSLAFSVTLLAVWVVGLISLTVYLFRRQDITS